MILHSPLQLLIIFWSWTTHQFALNQIYNCSTKYESKYVFKQLQLLAADTMKSVIVYYGVSDHGKGLVDAMSGFEVKGSLRRAVTTSNLGYSDSIEIDNFLIYKIFEMMTQSSLLCS